VLLLMTTQSQSRSLSAHVRPFLPADCHQATDQYGASVSDRHTTPAALH